MKAHAALMGWEGLLGRGEVPGPAFQQNTRVLRKVTPWEKGGKAQKYEHKLLVGIQNKNTMAF